MKIAGSVALVTGANRGLGRRVLPAPVTLVRADHYPGPSGDGRLLGPGSYGWALAGQFVVALGQPLVLNSIAGSTRSSATSGGPAPLAT